MDIPEVPKWLDGWTTVLGGAAALVLGLRSEARAFRERSRLSVTPVVGFTDPAAGWGPVFLGLDVTNHGSAAVSIEEIGFQMRSSQSRLVVPIPVVSGRAVRLPLRLEAHSSEKLWADPSSLRDLHDIRCGFVRTATGKLYTGRSKALKKVVRAGRLPPPQLRVVGNGMLSHSTLDWWTPHESSE